MKLLGPLVGTLLTLGLAACTASAEAPTTTQSKKKTAKTTENPVTNAPANTGASSNEGSASVTDLGSIAPDTEVGFDVAEGTLGFNIVVTGDPDSWIGVTSLVSPTGVVSVADFRPAGSELHIAIGTRGIGAFNVPQTDATTHGKVETGRWRIIVGGITIDPNTTIDKNSDAMPPGTKVTAPLHVVINTQKTSDGEFHGGAMDLHVYVPDGLALEDPGARHTLNAADAPNDDAMKARIDAFYDKLQNLFGIGRGEVSFHAIDARFLSARTGPARADLIRQASVAAPQALHVVFTNDMSYGDGDPLLGYSVGLPGAANSTGTFRSAITVASYDRASAITDATTMVHEMGHFIGLLHTTEFSGAPDLLADTPTCGASCGDNDPIPDQMNLMYPSDEGEDVTVTPSQVRVMQGSPIYRAFASAAQ